jgi:glutamate-1-semialdehyde 2,1-aminomutase/spore coat polysaccharide biosynthesis protein SpsF
MTDKSYSASQLHHKRALRTIPTASQTFSKSALMYVDGSAPLFAERGEGCYLWDIDGNRFTDYVLGLLPLVLGYKDPDVDLAITDQMARGITFSLATELEAELAEMLVDIIPCAEKVRFGKNGTDATSAAIRLARAHTGRDRVAVCGYHGWQDWYIGATPRHLGVPQAVRDLTATFTYNNAESLADLLAQHKGEFAAVILEPMTFDLPENDFLQTVKTLAHDHGALLVFDEIVTGFRAALGGAQEVFGVTPDLACFGKALGNGMPISAILGRADIMSLMDDIFFSGTFGGETLSLAASIATLKKLKSENAIERIHSVGRKLLAGTKAQIADHELEPYFQAIGQNWWPSMQPKANDRFDNNLLTSLMRQELVSQGLLYLSTFNICLAHDDEEIMRQTLVSTDRALANIATALRSNRPQDHLKGPSIEPIFQVRPGPKIG